MSPRASARAAAFAACGAVLAVALVATARARSAAELSHARERLLAGQLDGAEARRLASVPGEPLVLAALAAGRLDDAAALARLMRETGDPLGPLYAAVAAFEAGDEPAARRALAESRVAPSVRGLGARLARALAARDAGAHTLLLDRSGELVATVGSPSSSEPSPSPSLPTLSSPSSGPSTRSSSSSSASRSSPPGPAAVVRFVPEAAGLQPGLLERLPDIAAVAVARASGAPEAGRPGIRPLEDPPRVPAATGAAAVRLAVDLDLSRAALEALGDARGSIVLVDVASGGVLAAVADARTLAAEPAAPFAQRREPASIAKLLTAAAAYRAGLDADAAIARMSCGGVERYGGQPLWCAARLGPLSGLDHAMAQSCNVAFASLGVRLGAEAMQDEYARWGFGRPDPGARSAANADPGSGDDAGRVHTFPRTPRQLADLAVGLELVDVTPLHAALLAAAVAGGGTLPQARLVAGPCGPLGLGRPSASSQASDGVRAGGLPPDGVPANGVPPDGLPADGVPPDGVPPDGVPPDGVPPDGVPAGEAHDGSEALTQVLTPAVAHRLRQAMVEVVLSGTGVGLAPPGFPVAMKTGTAAEPGQGYHVNYVGFGPLPDASIAFCVRVTHERSSPAVTRRARDVTRRLLRALADRRGQVLRFAARSRNQG